MRGPASSETIPTIETIKRNLDKPEITAAIPRNPNSAVLTARRRKKITQRVMHPPT
jgi:hypothetical protein